MVAGCKFLSPAATETPTGNSDSPKKSSFKMGAYKASLLLLAQLSSGASARSERIKPLTWVQSCSTCKSSPAASSRTSSVSFSVFVAGNTGMCFNRHQAEPAPAAELPTLRDFLPSPSANSMSSTAPPAHPDPTRLVVWVTRLESDCRPVFCVWVCEG